MFHGDEQLADALLARRDSETQVPVEDCLIVGGYLAAWEPAVQLAAPTFAAFADDLEAPRAA